VFVELVGRGFGDERDDAADADGGPGSGHDDGAGRNDGDEGVEDLGPTPSADEAHEAYPVEAGR
jgi:hypothetical protein